jgi:uncharacterized OB-fold protein
MSEELDPDTATDEIKPEYKYSFNWDIDFSLNIGEDNRRFFEELENKRIMGNTCPECGDIFVPPQSVCVDCFVETDEWVEVDQTAVVESFTACFFEFENMPEPPYITGVLRVGDSAIQMMHFIEGIEYEDHYDLVDQLSKGDKVEPVWRDEPEGDIFDIQHFEPVE